MKRIFALILILLVASGVAGAADESADIDRSVFSVQKSEFWKTMAKTLVAGGI